MKPIGRYCKAYPASRLAEFRGWKVNTQTLSHQHDQGSQPDYVFLHDSFVVTSGSEPDVNIVFDAVTPEWIAFCRESLGFVTPEYLVADSMNIESQNASS